MPNQNNKNAKERHETSLGQLAAVFKNLTVLLFSLEKSGGSQNVKKSSNQENIKQENEKRENTVNFGILFKSSLLMRWNY